MVYHAVVPYPHHHGKCELHDNPIFSIDRFRKAEAQSHIGEALLPDTSQSLHLGVELDRQ